MGTYLGAVTIRNRYVNFKPLYEFENGNFHFINQYDRQALLPESAFGDINFYSSDVRQHVEDIFIDGTYCLLDFEEDELEDNITNGVRNQTGYKLDAIEKLNTGKIYYLSDIDYYYVLPENGVEGSYKTNPILEVTAPYAYEGLKVVIPVTDDKKTVIGPYVVEWREHDSKLVIRTGLQTQKYILYGYRFPTFLNEYIQQVGRYGDSQAFIHLDKSVCTETTVDVITKEQLLTAFRDTINSETDASIVALDYAVAQRILPHINGSGEKYRDQLKEIKDFCSDKNLRISSEVISDIIKTGEDAMFYFQFFA